MRWVEYKSPTWYNIVGRGEQFIFVGQEEELF